MARQVVALMETQTHQWRWSCLYCPKKKGEVRLFRTQNEANAAAVAHQAGAWHQAAAKGFDEADSKVVAT